MCLHAAARSFPLESHHFILIDGDLLRNSSGTAIGQSSLFFLVSSTTDSIFGAIAENSSTAIGSLLNGDDKILFRGDLSNYGADGVLSTSTGSLTVNSGALTGWTSGDPLALLWFPTLTSGSGTIVAGTQYGLYTNASAVDGSDAWITPADPTTNHKLLFYTQGASGGDLSPGAGASNLASAGNASLTVAGVPEPSRSLLGLIGLGVLALRRRR